MEGMEHAKKNSNYGKFGIMLLVSFCVMYAVMFVNVDRADHIYLSLTRVYMALLMVAPMAILMLLLMKMMYTDKKLNSFIMVSSILIFIGAFMLLRTQQPIGDVQYMKAMIPHHSSAILTSKEATFTDAEVQALAAKIIQSQEEEIAQMKAILARLK